MPSATEDLHRDAAARRIEVHQLAHEGRVIDRDLRESLDPRKTAPAEAPKPQPMSSDNSSRNRLRPSTFEGVVGQDQVKSRLQRMIEAALTRNDALDHVLLLGPAGTGKTTLALVTANELGRRCFQVSAPVSLDTLLELREEMEPGDILFVDEIHMQAIAERRGKESISAPEVFLTLLEDFTIMTPEGMLPFPRITVIGATTDPGRLPDAFLDRFPLEPSLDHYSERELALIAERNARALDLTLMPGVAELFAGAARRTPRLVNNFIRNAESLAPPDGYIPLMVAAEVLEMNQTTPDGLNKEMQATLKFLYRRCRRERAADGEITYSASINTIATAIGLSRDTKAVQLRVEPYLIEQGWLQVGSGGRALTPMGVSRALELIREESR